jgi:hypothetical protein
MAEERDEVRKIRIAAQWAVLLLAVIAALLLVIVFGIADVSVTPA